MLPTPLWYTGIGGLFRGYSGLKQDVCHKRASHRLFIVISILNNVHIEGAPVALGHTSNSFVLQACDFSTFTWTFKNIPQIL